MIFISLERREYIALCDLLKRVGLCESGAQAKAVISEGLVSVNGKVETRKRCKIKIDFEVQYGEDKIKVIY